MSTFNDKIRVTYTDLTNYANISRGDILGCAFEYHWGETDKLLTLTKSDFYRMFPESAPLGTFTLNGNEGRYNAYTQIKRYFENGGNVVEVVRCKGSWQFYTKNVTSSATVSANANASQFPTASSSAKIEVATKYAGMFPVSMIPDGCDGIAVELSYDSVNAILTVTVRGLVGSTPSTVIEKFAGGLVVGQYRDGAPFYIDDVVNNNSEYINIKFTALPTSFTDATVTFSGLASMPTAITWTSTMLDEYFKDRMISNATMVISPTSDESLNTAISAIANTRQNCLAITGFNIATTLTKANVITAVTSGTKDKFTMFVACKEQATLFGQTVPSNGIGGWCGTTALVAENVRLNQLASAFTYGAYNGTLTATLSLDDAVDLMDNYGVTSIINTATGNIIWGIKTTYNISTSYFAYANVMRVLSNFLRSAFPIAMSALHTDACSNMLTRSGFQQKFTNIVDSLIAGQNLADDSYVDVMGELNSDANTQGGKIFNVLCSLHFMKPVEEVVFHIVATDSSVSVQF